MRIRRLSTWVCFMSTFVLLGASREAQWKQVDDAMSKGLPKTAIEALGPIIEGALRDKAYPEATKAIARKIALEGMIQGNRPEEKVVRMEAEIAKAPAEMVPLLETLLADWYWQYFQQNRWRFMRRTATAQAPGKDFTTWDLPRLFQEIDVHFGRALAGADYLRQIPIASYNDLLQKGTLPDTYRPTLYDFIAQEALKFYTSGEQAAAAPENNFEISSDSPIFGTVEEFLAWNPTTSETNAPALKAIRLYQDLLRFHRKDPDQTAFIDVDLARLVFGDNTAAGETKTDRYKAGLKAFADRSADHEISAMALYQWAGEEQQAENLVEAHRLAVRGGQVFPESPGGKLCRNLVTQIEAHSVAISTERVWNAPFPKIAVRYRNVTRVYFRAVAYDWNLFLQKDHSRPEALNIAEQKELLAKAPVLEWSAELPPTLDYRERVEELPAPEKLEPGFYFLVASHNPSFTDRDNQITYTDVWVSGLALVIRPSQSALEGFVLDADSGEPVANAEIMAWSLDNRRNRVGLPAVRTDTNGFFTVPVERRGYLLRARHNGRELGSMQEYWSQPVERVAAVEQTVFFTDRALYRPGQTIQYKGIGLRVDQDKDNYSVLSRQRVTVVFEDPNQKEIARADHTANDYGAFSGSFTAPRDRLMGRMRIRVATGPAGETAVNVEEYKRPKFHVALEAPKTAAKLNDQVSLKGKAESYTGAAIDGAAVKYRVVREVRWPYWWGWYHWGPPRVQGSQEIAHGTVKTDVAGEFAIEFPAKPDPKVTVQDEAFFSFAVHADVTDGTGETRSSQRSVNVGYVALQAVLSAEDWQTQAEPVQLTIKTATLDDEPQRAEGSLKVYSLKPPATVQRPPLLEVYYGYGHGQTPTPKPDLSNPNNWELGEVQIEQGFTTDAEGKKVVNLKLPAGVYRVQLETQDRYGKAVTARLPLQVVDPEATRLAVKIPHLLTARDWTVEPGQEFFALWGTGYDTGRAFVEIEQRQKIVERYWTQPGQTQQPIKRRITEAMRGGFTVHVTRVRENRAYLESRHVTVPWSNKNLQIHWEHFVSKLQPGQKETWTAVIQGPDAQKAVAEMVAALYDESLDAYLPQSWLRRFEFFREDISVRGATFANVAKQFQHLAGQWIQAFLPVDIRHRQFPADLVSSYFQTFGLPGSARGVMRGRGVDMNSARAMRGAAVLSMAEAAPAAPMPTLGDQPTAGRAFFAMDKVGAAGAPAAEGASPAGRNGPDLNQVTARKNLNETAFFFPQLLSGKDGIVRMTFTMPEALTQWRFLGFAHDRACRSGYLEDKAVTAKDIMVQPNAPRFLREGDTLEFTVKVSNQSAARQSGKVRLTFTDARTEQPADASLANTQPEIAFDIPAKESRSFAWRITVPDGCGFLAYKAVGSTGRISDGEEGYLPVLARRILVTESLCLPIRGPATKQFSFARLVESASSTTLRNQSLTVQMVSNPAWYAVMALPYLMEFPYECTEQTFNRLYANALARTIANGDPKIHRVFEQWRGTKALESPLEKNQDLKTVALEETPWLRQALDESQARQNVGLLFDDNRLTAETEGTLRKLTDMQLPDGAWPWFPGGHGNDYITLYITTGFGRLRHLGVDLPVIAAVKSLERLDNWMDERYQQILKHPKPEDYVPSSLDALYLYGRSFFLKDKPVPANRQAAVDFYLRQAYRFWLQVGDRQSQGHLALALHRWGGETNRAAAQAIMRSIKERSVTTEEMGMFWRDTEMSWWWYRAPIETQALMIEAFDEVMGDAPAVEECRVWLLKQKQTRDWKTTKATADAVYALLLRGRDILASDELVEVKLGNETVRPRASSNGTAAVEAGTGFYEKRFLGPQIQPAMGKITVKKVDAGVAWGSVNWQYLEDMTRVTAYAGTPLQLKKTLFIKTASQKGPVLEPVKGPVSVGDELVVRIELRADRDFEYVHLKDQRGSGTEPSNVLSGYRYQDGLAYYESTRDTASHFFIEYLPKGTYVFEYASRIQHRGQYQTGIAEIQCMYAPEFNSHSEGFELVVK